MIEPLALAKAGTEVLGLLPGLANRHGLVAGATGTGKTVTLQVLAEGFSRIGVPVFMADVKGDLSGIAAPGSLSPKMKERLAALGLGEPAWAGCPVVFWDVYGEQGHPVRATISDMGPLLLGRLLNLNDTQSGVLTLVFKIADDSGLLLLDLKDLRAMLQHVGERAAQVRAQYGNVSPASIGAIQRRLLELEQQGAGRFFGEPMLNIDDLMQTDATGRGVVNVLAADRLMQSPKLYSTLLLWLLAELYENLPEVGDLDKPKLVFFFDEAHLLFDDAAKALLEKVEQVVRLIRSKGVGIYFCQPEPARHPRDCARPARQPRPARVARVHPARTRRRCGRRPRPCARIRSSTPSAPSPSWGWARRWCRCSTRRARRRSSSARSSCRQVADRARSRRRSARG